MASSSSTAMEIMHALHLWIVLVYSGTMGQLYQHWQTTLYFLALSKSVIFFHMLCFLSQITLPSPLFKGCPRKKKRKLNFILSGCKINHWDHTAENQKQIQRKNKTEIEQNKQTKKKSIEMMYLHFINTGKKKPKWCFSGVTQKSFSLCLGPETYSAH